jgi:Putative beta-barrel porin 2
VENLWDLLMSRTLQVSESTSTIPRLYFWASLLLLTLLLRTMGECGDPEQSPVPVESVPIAPGQLPPPQEQILTPIPRQFDWMRRTVRSNPLLESLLRLREVTPRLLMSVSLTEEYSDNFFLSDSDPQDVFRTSLNLGTVYRVESGRGFVSLANSLRGSYDIGAGQGTFAFANLSFTAGYELPRLSLSLSESFIRSDEPGEATPIGVRRQRQPFSQNIVSPQLRYALTPTTALTWAYTNTLVWNSSMEQDNTDPSASNLGSVVGNSVTNALSAGLQHWFRRDLSGSVGYLFSLTNSKESGDTQTQAALGDLAYIISPRTTASFRAFGTLIDQHQGTSDASTSGDAQIFGVSFSARRQLTTFLTAFASVGPTVVDRQHRPTRLFANWQVSLDSPIPLTQRTSVSLSTQQSINDTAGDINDVGLVLSQSATLTLTHTVSRDLFASVFANFGRTQMLEDIATDGSTQGQNSQDFTYWSTGASLSYALSRIWSISAAYRYQHRDSDVPSSNIGGTSLGGKYSENRLILSLSAAFPVF